MLVCFNPTNFVTDLKNRTLEKIIVFALLVSSFCIQAQDLSDLYEKVNPSVVIILTEEKEIVNIGNTAKTVTANGLGSGFLISDKRIITAAHLV